jgi:hypothetical protein
MLALLDRFRAPVAPVPPRLAASGDATRTLDAILRAAAREGASDVHCEPKEDGLVIRFRLDGEMREHTRLPLAQRDALIARGKITGGMDITEKRLPQDGRALLQERGRRFHLRMNTVPTVHGESLVVRLLDQAMPAQSFLQLGLSAAQAAAVQEALTGPAGLIFLTGPTGSGKTTTLHAALHTFDHSARVIHTLEEPVEYEFPGIRQTEIREKVGLTFATALRAMLRQNPDVILVGETRDAEDGAARGARRFDRAPGAFDAAHQRCLGGNSAAARPRRGNFSAGGGIATTGRAAARAETLCRVQGTASRQCAACRRAPRARSAILPAGRLPGLSRARLPRSARHP